MDIIVWFMEDESAATASAVTKAGALALAQLLFVEAPVYVIQVGKTPQEFVAEIPKGIVACLYTDGLLQELETDINCLQ